jgi:hypothetical protein
MNENEMELIRQGLRMLLNRNLDTRDFIHKSDSNSTRHAIALPVIEEEIREIEALLAKLPQVFDSVLVAKTEQGKVDEAPPKKLAPSEKEKSTSIRKKKSS